MKDNTAGVQHLALVRAHYMKTAIRALELAANDAELLCITKLYLKANQNRYMPIRATWAALALEFGMSRSSFQRLIYLLQEEGLVIWDCKSGSRGRLLVLEPTFREPGQL